MNGKQKKLALGPYPEITLADARERTLEARRDVLNGGDPALERKKYQKLAKARDGATFASVAQEAIRAPQSDPLDSSALLPPDRR